MRTPWGSSLVVAAGALATAGAQAQRTIRVPSQIGTIQAAIQAAQTGDTVLVARGTYSEALDFLGKGVRVVSEAGPALTILDGGRVRSVVSFVRSETRRAVLEGFTIANGRSLDVGGGVRVAGASPTLLGNVIRDCVACASGGGVVVQGGSPLLLRNQLLRNRQSGCPGGLGGGVAIVGAGAAVLEANLLDGNSADNGGGIALVDAGTPTVLDNQLRGNVAGSGAGGGIVVLNASDPLLVQNTLVANRALQSGGGVSWLVPNGSRGPILANNTFVDNDCRNGGALFADGFDLAALVVNNVMVSALAGQTVLVVGRFGDGALPVIQCNDVFSPAGRGYGGLAPDLTGLLGNLAVDPGFVDPRAADFRLRLDSRCVDAGLAGVPGQQATDPDGDDRVIDGDGDGRAVIDMGADEFAPLRGFGVGCAGSGGYVPRARGIGGAPVRGNLGFGIGLDQALGGTDAILLIGASDQSWRGLALPFALRDFGLPDCALQVSLDGSVAVRTVGRGAGFGSASALLGVPADANLRGLVVFVQWWVVDPGPGPVPAALSAPLRIQVL